MLTGTCDICDKENRELRRVVAYGIETYSCLECLGEPDEEKETETNQNEHNQNDRYETFRKWAVTSTDDLAESQTYYMVYCLGKASFVSNVVINSASPKKCGTIGEEYIIIDNSSAYLDDHGLGKNNCNEHLIFSREDKAQEYAEACKNDLDECNSYKEAQEMLNFDYCNEPEE
jgi:hypothetical protein